MRLDLSALDSKAAAAAVTGIPAGQVTVLIAPTVRSGLGAPFAPTLRLTLAPLQLSLAGDPQSLVVADPTPPPATHHAATVTLIGQTVPASTARDWSLLFLVVSALSALVIVLLARQVDTVREGDGIRRRYSSLLVPIEPMSASPNRPIVDVTEMPTLVKLAERYGLLVLHWSRSGVETFVVQDENTTYRYRAGGAGTDVGTDIGTRRRRRSGSAKSIQGDEALTADGQPG